MLASKSTTVRLGIKGGTRSLVAQTYRGFTYRPIPVSCSAASGESKVIVRIPESKEEAVSYWERGLCSRGRKYSHVCKHKGFV